MRPRRAQRQGRCTVDVLGPHQTLQPSPGVRIRGVERVEVEPDSPADLRHGVGQGYGSLDRAGQRERALLRTDPVSGYAG